MRRIALLFAAMVLATWTALAAAQTEGRPVSGVINDALGRPLAQARVFLKTAEGKTIAQTRTGDDGRFTFSDVAPGTYAVTAEKQNFKQGTAIVTVGAAAPRELVLTMASEQALDVSVTAARLDRARNALSPKTGSSQFTFQQADIAALPLGDNTAFNDLLVRAPGVANDNFGQLHIRGDHANIQYRINGVILPEGITGFGSALDTRFASRVDLLTGALPAQYGYRTAGVVEIETKSAYESGGRVGLLAGSHDTTNPSLELSGAAGPVNYYLTGSFLRNKLGLENPTGAVDAIHDLTQQEKGFGYFSILPSATTRISAMFGTYEGRFQIPNAPGLQPDQTTGFTTLNGSTMFDSASLDDKQREVNRYGILALQSTLGENIDYQVAVFQRYTSLHFMPDLNGDLVFLGNASELLKTDRATGIQADASVHLNDRHTLRSGLFFSNEAVVSNNNAVVFDASNNIVNIQDDNSKGGNHLFGVYLQDEWKLTRKLSVNYGLRYDQMNAFVSADQWSPRLGTTYQWSPQTTLHAAYSRYFTPPPTELVAPKTIALFANTSAAAPAVANDPVLPERTHYFDVGATHRLTPALTVGADYYYKRVTNLLDEGQFGPAPIFTPFNYQEGRVQGLELTANYKKDDLSAYLNLAWSAALGKNVVSSQASAGFQQSELDFIATNWVHLDHDQTYTASGGVSYQVGKARYSVDAIFGSGLRVTPDDTTNNNSGHLPSYFTMNLAATYRFDDTPFGRLDGRLAVINLFDKAYELRDGTGVGVGPPAFGQRRALYAGISKPF